MLKICQFIFSHNCLFLAFFSFVFQEANSNINDRMGVLKYKNGWLVQVWIQGVYVRKYFKDKALAEAVYLELKKKQELARIAKKLRGVDEGLAKLLGSEFQKGELIKLKVFWGQYLKWLLTHKKEWTVRERLSKWKKIKEYFGEKTLIEITPEAVARFQINLREAGYTGAAINRYVALIRHILSMAVKWGYLREHPLKGKIEMMRETHDWTFISKEEFYAIREFIGDNYRDLFDFLVMTGARLGEALKLRWEDIVWEAGVAYLKDSKTNRPRVLVLSDEVIRLLEKRKERLRAREEERVFIHSDSEFRRAFKRALEKAGIERRVRVHDLRHTFASWLALQGVQIQHIKEMMGHTEIRTTMRYAHLNVEVLRKTLNSVFKGVKRDSEGKVISLSEYLQERAKGG